ncbi:hypothetical protein [Faecalicatena contorta]|uniref:ABC-2 family transporter protein n=1 Tax=Faecalicatena contorta TaxID=39482 RepID=A0A315ZVN0_9FIRM|nr:hypothetical protein [Faecalicatena contorta]PWJ48918.1 hypothetical protein A8805_10959 [Faecalicatena contorta]SUQ15008.1 hypothetical protein SAMN05216529_10959 [Faecalicatena contorta]
MKNKMKKQLKIIYEAPEPLEKEGFLKAIGEPEISHWRLLAYQIRYIRKWNWALAAVIFLTAIIGVRTLEKEIIFIVATSVPFLALSMVVEGSRSLRYGMEELEMASRFSIKTVLAARLGALGISNMILLCVLVPVLYDNKSEGILYTGLYILIPYFLTTFLDLAVIRKVHRNEGTYLCFGSTVLVSVGCLLCGGGNGWLSNIMPSGYKEGAGIIMLIVLAVLIAKEIKKVFTQWEEYVWNLS